MTYFYRRGQGENQSSFYAHGVYTVIPLFDDKLKKTRKEFSGGKGKVFNQ